MGNLHRLAAGCALPGAARVLCAALMLLVAPAQSDQKRMVGWLERVLLTTEGIMMDAKVDTGADVSSVRAEILGYREEGGQPWVEFALHDNAGKRYVLKRPLRRKARIKSKTGGTLERPVVQLELCIGNRRYTAQVNLAKRPRFKYPLLLGRSFLKGRFVVDPERQYLLTPACQ